LWHGAGWNFVVWGGMHGLLLLLHRQFRNPTPDNAALGRRDWAKIFLMFNAASLLWVFFRVPTFGDAMLVFQRLVTGSYVETWPVMQVWVVSLCVILQVVERVARERLQSLRDALGPVWGGALEGAALGVVASLLIYFGGSGGEFIYFQF
jgi:alginate O-acetyltransferase complex protein AlgI